MAPSSGELASCSATCSMRPSRLPLARAAAKRGRMAAASAKGHSSSVASFRGLLTCTVDWHDETRGGLECCVPLQGCCLQGYGLPCCNKHPGCHFKSRCCANLSSPLLRASPRVQMPHPSHDPRRCQCSGRSRRPPQPAPVSARLATARSLLPLPLLLLRRPRLAPHADVRRTPLASRTVHRPCSQRDVAADCAIRQEASEAALTGLGF